MLVRSDGSVLTKDEVLADLRAQNLNFESIELIDEKLRIIDSETNRVNSCSSFVYYRHRLNRYKEIVTADFFAICRE